jgi:hypothetical protein
MTAPRLAWVRVGDRYPDLKGVPDYFLALDGEEEVGLVRRDLTGSSDEGRWIWSMLLRHPEPSFRQPTNGACETRLLAVREFHECWHAFRKWFGIDDAG